MRSLIKLVVLILLTNCSLDNKSGIWKNENEVINEKDENIFKDFKKVASTIEGFDEIIIKDKNYKFNLNKPFQNNIWNDIFYNKNNNIINLRYDNKKKIIHKTKKLSKYDINEHVLYENNNVVLNDDKGNLIIYSIEDKSIKTNYNFYKKRYKDIKKNLNLILNNQIIFVTDNLGYVYAFDIKKNKLIWAKNLKIPFRSNLKIFSDKLIASNQNNDLYIIDKTNGNLIKLIPSEESLIKNAFVNSISLGPGKIFFLNTFGSIYSIDSKKYNLNWFLNLNKTLDLNLTSLFFGSNLVYNENKIFVSSKENFYILNSNNGSTIYKKNFSSSFKPLISNNHIFIITKNNLLISIDLNDGKIVYSYSIPKKISEFTSTKQRDIKLKNFMLVNGDIFIFLKNSFVLKFNVNGEIDEIFKLPAKIKTKPIIVNNSLIFLGNNNKLFILN